MYYVLKIDSDCIPHNYLCKTIQEAEDMFLRVCRESIWNFNEYTQEDIETILEKGIANAGKLTILIYPLSNQNINKGRTACPNCNIEQPPFIIDHMTITTRSGQILEFVDLCPYCWSREIDQAKII